MLQIHVTDLDEREEGAPIFAELNKSGMLAEQREEPHGYAVGKRLEDASGERSEGSEALEEIASHALYRQQPQAQPHLIHNSAFTHTHTHIHTHTHTHTRRI